MTQQGGDSNFQIDSLLGPTLLQGTGKNSQQKKIRKPTKTLMEGKELVALYFSAAWCAPCKTFSPLLSSFYENCAAEGNLEVVYVSRDKNLAEFKGNYATMPFLAVPPESGVRKSLVKTFGITQIPSLVLVDVRTGEFISNVARNGVLSANGDVAKGKKLIEVWKTSTRYPLSEATSVGKGVVNSEVKSFMDLLIRVAKWIMGKPVTVIVIVYMYANGLFKFQQRQTQPSSAVADTPSVNVDINVDPKVASTLQMNGDADEF